MSIAPEQDPPPWESLSVPTPEERNLAVLSHIGGVFTAFVVPLVIWLVKKDQSRFVAEHAREALNFQLAVCIYCLVCIVLAIVLIGFLMAIALAVFEIVVVVQACIAASRGELYRYPLSIRFFKE